MRIRGCEMRSLPIEDPEEIQRIKLKREKDEKELNDLCKKICLCLGWSFVLILIIYICFIMLFGP